MKELEVKIELLRELQEEEIILSDEEFNHLEKTAYEMEQQIQKIIKKRLNKKERQKFIDYMNSEYMLNYRRCTLNYILGLQSGNTFIDNILN